ncbi:sugar phosphate nucleotidyltransferase, partial [Acinetobacter baumannii]|uniref:sugar phosphate nucleotidyltransferase n=1 Tax=Acinetobacter baumannii TaxID=470 RepID=UPI00224437D4
AVMEKTQLACVVPMSAGWSDVGSWSSIWDVHENITGTAACSCSAASVFLDELKKHDPDIYDTCWVALERSVKNGDEVLIDPATFACCPDNSIDYAVMEKTQLACVVPMSAGWSDVGSWSSIWDVHE